MVKGFDEFSVEKHGKFGRRAVCKLCRKVYKTGRRTLRSELSVVVREKQCQKCKEVKPAESFVRSNISPDLLQHYCKLCQNEYRNEWRTNK